MTPETTPEELAKALRNREAAIRESERRLQQVQKLESLGVLAGGIAHDFNNLLTGILGYSDLLGRMLPEKSESSELAREIGLLAERASQLCERIRTYGGRPLERPTELDLSAVTREAVSLARASLPKGTHLELDLGPVELPILGNEVEVLQLAMNAILNGAESLDEGTGAVHVSLRPVEVDEQRLTGRLGSRDARPGTYAELAIRDDGRGIDRETLDRMFDPFFTTKGPGRGLGLSAVVGIIRSHGGVLEVESTVGKGTTFRALFPKLCGELRAENDLEPQNPCEKLYARVLLVDDEASVREVAARILEFAGCEVRTVATGGEGLAAYAADPSFDAVLIDMALPDVGGLKVAEGLRKAGCDAAIVLTSGSAGEHPLPPAFPHFLAKPFGEIALRRCIAEALAASGRVAPLRS
ncbi:MAG: response regulator [Myxococcales bacterium]|nr:response regulator [Myxococcales bacterium]